MGQASSHWKECGKHIFLQGQWGTKLVGSLIGNLANQISELKIGSFLFSKSLDLQYER